MTNSIDKLDDLPSWGVAEAKAHFSEVLERARHQGPQRVLRKGKPAVVVVAEEVWAERVRGAEPELSALAFFEPLRGLNLDLTAERISKTERESGPADDEAD